MIDQKTINEIRDLIVETYQPEKIILFGSYANGNPTDDSDLDLLIVVETEFLGKTRFLHLPTCKNFWAGTYNRRLT